MCCTDVHTRRLVGVEVAVGFALAFAVALAGLGGLGAGGARAASRRCAAMKLELKLGRMLIRDEGILSDIEMFQQQGGESAG
jgi:hypothetical protein